MELSEREASLVDAFRRLPPDTAAELSALAQRLAELAPNHRIDWSDSWSDEDLNDSGPHPAVSTPSNQRIGIEAW